MRRLSITTSAMLLAAICVAGLPADNAWAARKKSHDATSATKTHKAKRTRSSSEESAAERDRRLRRECKGLPNAGACLGYAN